MPRRDRKSLAFRLLAVVLCVAVVVFFSALLMHHHGVSGHTEHCQICVLGHTTPSTAAIISLALSPRPDGRESSPATASPPEAGGAGRSGRGASMDVTEAAGAAIGFGGGPAALTAATSIIAGTQTVNRPTSRPVTPQALTAH